MICIGNRKVYIYSIFQFTNTYTFIIHIYLKLLLRRNRLPLISNTYTVYIQYTFLFLLLLPICYLCFFPSHISPSKKRRRDFEISKFSPSICVWKQIRIVLQWSVLLNIKRGTKTSVVIVFIRIFVTA